MLTRSLASFALGASFLLACAGDGSSKTDEGFLTQPSPMLGKGVDDACFDAYAKAASTCNAEHEDETSFTMCLVPLKSKLRACCAEGGSSTCIEDATLSAAEQKVVDDQCFLEYSHGAGGCNDASGDDESAFDRCIQPLKTRLRKCCNDDGGSPSCAEDAR